MKTPIPGIYRVRHPDGAQPFNLSVVETFGVRAVRPFLDGQPRPKHGLHYMPNDMVRAWLNELEVVQ